MGEEEYGTKQIKILRIVFVVVCVFIFYFFNLFFCIMFFDVGDIKWCSRPNSLLFYGIGLSYRCLFLSKFCSYAFAPHTLFECLLSDWATT